MKNKSESGGKILISFYISYLILLVSFIIVMIVSFFVLNQTVKNEIMKSGEKKTENLRAAGDSLILKMENTAMLILEDNYIANHSNNTQYMNDGERYDMLSLTSRIFDYKRLNDSVQNILIYFPNSETVVTDSTFTDTANFIANNNLDINISEWRNMLLSDSSNKLCEISLSDGTTKLMYINHSLYMNKKINMSFAAIIDKDEFISGKNIDDASAGYFVADRKGNINSWGNIILNEDIAKSISDRTVDDTKYFYFYKDSGTTGLTYVYLYEKAGLTKMMLRLMIIYIAMSIFVILCGVWGIAKYSGKSYAGLKTLLSSVGEFEHNKKYGDYMESVAMKVQEVLRENYTLKNKNGVKRMHLKKYYIKQLLMGNKDEAEAVGTEFWEGDNPDSYMNKYAVMLFLFKDMDVDELLIETAITLLNNAFGDRNMEYIQRENVSIIAVLNLGENYIEENPAEDFGTIIEEYKTLIEENLHTEIIGVIGNVVEGIENIRYSYLKALTLMDSSLITHDKNISSCDDETNQNINWFSEESERLLVNAVSTGDASVAHNIMRSVINGCIEDKNVIFLGMKYLVTDIVCAVIKAVSRMGGTAIEDFSKVLHNEQKKLDGNYREYSDALNKIVDYACGIEQDNSSDLLKNRVMDILQTNYTDPQLSYVLIADMLDMNPVYLSHSFKQQAGEGISVCLEKIRLKKSIELLGQGMKVVDVAKAVGYNNPKTFSRAFKRVYGVNPTNYKQ